MNEKEIKRTIELSQKLIALIRKDHKKFLKKEELEEIANEILHWQIEFVAYKIKSEQAFRARIREITLAEKVSFAAAENQAMTEEVYYTHKRVKYINEISEEKVKVLKLMIGSSY